MLPFALHRYKISICTSTRATSFSLVYGFKVVLPIEVQVSSLRIIQEVELHGSKVGSSKVRVIKFHRRKETECGIKRTTVPKENSTSV